MVRTICDAPVDLARVLADAQLPALPQSAIRLLELSQNPDNGPAEFAVPIESDPGLTGQVLKFVNSSYFGFAREIASVKLAITMVGVRTIKNFALWSAVFSLMPNPKCGPFDLNSLWQDSLRRGLFARRFGQLLGVKDAEDLFAGALLQDMAIPLLAKELSQQYLQLLSRRAEGRQRLSQLEQEAFGWTHADAGARLATQWNLPEEFARLIESHTQIERLAKVAGSSPRELAVALSSLLPPACDDAWHEGPQLEAFYQALRPADALSLADLLAEVDRQFNDFAPILKINCPARSLADRYQSLTAATA